MITFERGDIRFNYRVVGIALDGERVLLHRWETDDFWALPGGRGELHGIAAPIGADMLQELCRPAPLGLSAWSTEALWSRPGLAWSGAGGTMTPVAPRAGRKGQKAPSERTSSAEGRTSSPESGL